MLHSISSSLSNVLYESDISEGTERDVYCYGIELILNFFVILTSIMITGFLLGSLPQSITFTITFILLRAFFAGYHADKYWKCFVISNSIHIAVIFASSIIHKFYLPYYLLLAVAFIIILIKAPCNDSKELSSEDRIYKRKTAIIFAFIALIISVFGMMLTNSKIFTTMGFSFIAATLIMLPNNCTKKRELENNVNN